MAFEIRSVFSNVIEDLVDKLIVDGKSEGEIKSILESKNSIEACSGAIDKMASFAIEHLQSDMSNEMNYINSVNAEFYTNNLNKWGEAFDYYETLYFMIIEASEIYTEGVAMIDSKIVKEKRYLYEVIRAIHAKGIQTYIEILCLIKNGFADGAFARWRSIYELEVTTRFIVMHGENVAKRYYYHTLDDNHYDWASDCFKSLSEKGSRITFNNLEEKCKFYKNKWENAYGLASKIIHPSPSGVFGKFSNAIGCHQNYLNVGRSDYGIHIPAIYSIQQIILLTSDFFTLFSELDIDASFYLYLLDKWGEIARNMFLCKHKDIFGEDTLRS